jgi:thioredoxin 1
MTLIDNAEAEIGESESIVALFFAQWCPYCRAFKPAFEKTASSSDRDCGLIDISDEKSEYWDRYGISIVPTVIVFSNGEVIARKDGKPRVGLRESELKDLLDETED